MSKELSTKRKKLNDYMDDWWKRWNYDEPVDLSEYEDYDPTRRDNPEDIDNIDEYGFIHIAPVPIFARAYDELDVAIPTPAELSEIYRKAKIRRDLIGKKAEEFDDDDLEIFDKDDYDTGYYIDDDDGVKKTTSTDLERSSPEDTTAATPKNESGE